MKHDEQILVIRALNDWKARARLAADAVEAFDRFDQAADVMLDDRGEYLSEVASVALAAVSSADASISHDESAPSPGAELLISALGGPTAAVATLLSVIRTLAESVR